MLNYLKKFTMDILPSVAATIIGAYIVNHYIVTRPKRPPRRRRLPMPLRARSDRPPVDPKPDPKAAADAKPAEKPTQVSSLPEAGVKAKGMSERTLIERSASEKATVVEKPQDKPADPKSVDLKPTTDAPAETASIPAEPHRHQVAPRDKTAVRVVLPSPVQPVAPAAVRPRSRLPSRLPPSHPMNAATPTISRVPRSSACATTMRSRAAGACPRAGSAHGTRRRRASRPRRRSDRCRRRSWCRIASAIISIKRAARPPYAASPDR